MAKPAPSMTSPPWDLTTKRIVALFALALALLIAREVSDSVWASIIVAVVLSYLLSPVVVFFERRLSFIVADGLRRSLAVLLTWFGVVGMLALGLVLIAPAMISQLREFADSVPDVASNAESTLRDVLDRQITIGEFTVVPWDELERAFSPADDDENGSSTISETVQNAVLSLADPALDVLGGAVSFLLTLFFVLAMLFYLMRDGPLFADYLVGVAPESYQGDMRRLLYELGQIWNAYLRGQVLLCFAVGIATYIAALILGLPQPLVLALVAGFLEFIPNLGPGIAQIPAVLFALTTPSSTIPALDAGIAYAVVVSLTYIAIQNLEAIFLVPRIMGNSLDLHPFAVLVAVLVGASLFGVLGVVLAAPSAATLRLLARYVRGKLLDEDVFPAREAYSVQKNRLAYSVMHYLLSKRFHELPDPPAPGGPGAGTNAPPGPRSAGTDPSAARTGAPVVVNGRPNPPRPPDPAHPSDTARTGDPADVGEGSATPREGSNWAL